MTTITPSGFELRKIEGLTGGWALDRFDHPLLGLSRTAVLLGRAKVAGMEAASAQLGDRMASIVYVRSLPDDLVVTAVPSASGMNEVLAQRVAAGLDRPLVTLLDRRAGFGSRLVGRRGGSEWRMIRPTVRRAPAHVLLVDEAVRTGDTLRFGAALMRGRGADEVWAVSAVAFEDVMAGLPAVA
jgi:phosphoribosylpyrophosphate synthetase